MASCGRGQEQETGGLVVQGGGRHNAKNHQRGVDIWRKLCQVVVYKILMCVVVFFCI